MAHLRAVPDDDVPEDVAEADRVIDPVDPAAATAPGEDDPPHDDANTTRRSRSSRVATPRRSAALSTSASSPWRTALFITYGHDLVVGIQILGGSLLAAALIRLVLANR